MHATVPPKVEYSLSAYRRTLRPALLAICDWGGAHMKRIGAVAAFDAAAVQKALAKPRRAA